MRGNSRGNSQEYGSERTSYFSSRSLGSGSSLLNKLFTLHAPNKLVLERPAVRRLEFVHENFFPIRWNSYRRGHDHDEDVRPLRKSRASLARRVSSDLWYQLTEERSLIEGELCRPRERVLWTRDHRWGPSSRQPRQSTGPCCFSFHGL